MRIRRLFARPREEVPTEIYISLVDSLYDDPRSLAAGSIGTIAAALITGWRTGEPLIYLCTFALAVVACARAADMRAFVRNRPNLHTTEQGRLWEMRYVAGAAAYVALLGTWCLIGFVRTHDPFVELFSFAACLGYLIGIAGRNFGSSALVSAQILCAGGPLAAALLSASEPYYTVFAFVLVPFFTGMKFIADRLRRTLLDAVIATRDITFLASRFDTALNNMPLGLCMFDATGRLVVANRRSLDLLGLPSEIARRGASMHELVQDCMRAGRLSAADAARLADEFERRGSEPVGEDFVLETQDGRVLALTFQPMENGGSVVLIEDITERRNAEAKINHLARYDGLTGLPNRAFFREHMERALALIQRGGSCAVLFVDLDQFKQVNDTLGHPFGDQLLRCVADRLRGLIRDSDVVARFGGDEFVVLQAPVRRPEQVASLARRIVDVLGEPYQIEGHEIVIGASIGIAVAPNDGADADLLLKNADMALYRAKSDGRAGWRFFEPEMDIKAQARRNLELDLRTALANDTFEVYYQPLYNLRNHRVSTCEALLRWPHPERGMISPAEFIPVAEEMGLIVEIGSRVLRKACIECTRWPADVRVAVNLSPIQFRRGSVVAAVKDALAVSKLSPNRLEVEITESVLLQDTEQTRLALNELRELGVRISLDDFGTGYSSLSYLHSFPLHKVKIDRMFLRGILADSRSLTLLRGVARLSAELGMSVVVEGIETEAELAIITRETTVDEAQGFLFSRPVPGRDIRKILYSAGAMLGRVA
ncbi:MAG TPA: EAL domain-containing protein [Xanthobacteraceae bacterium]